MTEQTSLCKTIKPDYIPGTGLQMQLLNIRHIQPHRHSDAVEMMYCLQGHVWGHIAHDELHLRTGDLVTFDRDDAHNIMGDKDNLCLVAHIDLSHPSYSHDELFETIFSCTTHPKYTRHPEEVQRVCDVLLAAMYIASEGQENAADICEEIRLNLTDLLMKKFSWFSIEEWYREGDDKYADRLRMILKYILNNYRSKITISELSKIIYLNPSYISSFMKRTTFHSFSEAVNYFRCFYAEHLLLETDLPMGEISAMAGFSSEKYFYRAFKMHWRTTPLQQRKEYARLMQIKEEYYEYPQDEAREIIKEYIAARQVEKARFT
jgi:AraC-like DNA-binding protein